MINQNLLLTGDDGYNLTNSLRFRSSASAYLSKTWGSNGSSQTFTVSTWLKRGALGAIQAIVTARQNGLNNLSFRFTASDTLEVYAFSGGSSVMNLITTQVFRDPSAWYHFVFAVDTTQATSSNRVKFYINGTQITAFSTATYPSLNATTLWNQTAATHYFATYDTSSELYDGYIAETNVIDGQALTPSSFGETSTSTGVWIPKKYTGTYGTNGFYLPFTNTSSTSTLGNDFSGNSNTWTVNNISLTAGSTYDSMTDVPTLTSATAANYAVLNPLAKNSSNTVSNGNLSASGNVIYGHVQSTIFASSGKFYFEAQLSTQQNDTAIGLGNTNSNPQNDFTGGSTNSVGYLSDGRLYYNGSLVATYSSYTTGDTVACAFDCATGKIWIAKNNTWQNSGDPAAGTGSVQTVSWTEFTGLARTVGSGAISVNFGQRPFAYTPPTGFVRLNTFNLTTPTIGATASTQAGKYFNTVLYTGNGSSQTVTGFGFDPDMVWHKGRSVAYNHSLVDVIRGNSNILFSNTTDAEANPGAQLALATDGATVTYRSANLANNQNAATYVIWGWKGNGAGVTNTAGSITSTVSANTTAGFSVVTYTASSSASTIGHGLGVAPSMIIQKNRDAVSDWGVYHISIGATKFLKLNTSDIPSTNSVPWNDTAPTSSVFSIGTGYTNGNKYVAYCFAEVAGYSKFGSYVGNGSNDGPFIFTGFKPKFILTKNITTAGYWWEMVDSARSPYNTSNVTLYANVSDSEYTSSTYNKDLVSNGFKIRGTSAAQNSSGDTFIYMAFAENPFKYANAR